MQSLRQHLFQLFEVSINKAQNIYHLFHCKSLRKLKIEVQNNSVV